MSIGVAVSAFGASAAVKRRSAAAVGQPEDQIRGPFERLLENLSALCGFGKGTVVAVGVSAEDLFADIAAVAPPGPPRLPLGEIQPETWLAWRTTELLRAGWAGRPGAGAGAGDPARPPLHRAAGRRRCVASGRRVCGDRSPLLQDRQNPHGPDLLTDLPSLGG